MRKVTGVLVPAAGLLFVLLCAYTALMWWRSYQGPDYLHYTSERQWALSVISGHGTVDVLVIRHWPQEAEFRTGRYDPYVYYGTRYSKRFMGFGTGLGGNGGRYVNIPHWFLVCVFAGMAVACGRWFYRRFWRYPEGLCQACGYDLRATPGRCPECGHVAADSCPATIRTRIA